MRLWTGARPALCAALAVAACASPARLPVAARAPAARAPASARASGPAAVPTAPATQPAPAWRSFPAPHWFEFTLAYPPEWTLEPVVLLHDRLLLELVHGVTGPDGAPLARFYVEAERFSGGKEINEWRRELLATLEQEAWAARGPVTARREAQIAGSAAVDVRRGGPGGWSRALLIPLNHTIVVLRLVSDAPNGQSPQAAALERRFDELAGRLVPSPLPSIDQQWVRRRAIMAAVEAAGKGAVACGEVVPGHLNVAFRDTVPVTTARQMVAELMRRGLRPDDFTSPLVGSFERDWLFDETSPYLTIGYKFERRGFPRVSDAAHRLARDRRVVRVHHHEHRLRRYCVDGADGLVFGVELRPGARVEEIVRDHRDFVAFPRDVRVMSGPSWLERAPRGPGLALLAHQRLARDLDALAALRRSVPPDPGVPWLHVTYADVTMKGYEFQVTFPARYSRREIEAAARRVFDEERLGKGPPSISLGLFVGVGREDQWEAELRRRPEVEAVFRPPRLCPRPHRH